MLGESAAKHFVIVGLGNPGEKYTLTRHNIGYLVVQAFGLAHGWMLKEERQFCARVAKGKIGEMTVHLLLPTTYMNESGRALRLYLDFYKLKPADVCVICDDVHLAFGQMRLRRIGSPGGHNGLKSIQTHLHTQDYLRLRMGVGRTHQQDKTLAEYVLDVFTAEERLELADFVVNGAQVVKRLVSEDILAVMNTVNRSNDE